MTTAIETARYYFDDEETETIYTFKTLDVAIFKAEETGREQVIYNNISGQFEKRVMPSKPVNKRKRNMCPACKVGYVYENDNYCANCGIDVTKNKGK